MSTVSSTDQVPQDARDRAKALGWEDGLIERALEQGNSLQEVWQALRGNVDGALAKQFLAGGQGGFVRPDPWWMRVPTEWGIKARPATVITRNDPIHPAIHSAAFRLECALIVACVVATPGDPGNARDRSGNAGQVGIIR